MLGILISAALLCAIMFVLARHEAEIDFKIVLLICLGVSVLNLFTYKALGYLAIPITLVVLAWALQKFCYLSWAKAFLVTIVYVVASTGISLLFR
jgi:hypothetical protein